MIPLLLMLGQAAHPQPAPSAPSRVQALVHTPSLVVSGRPLDDKGGRIALGPGFVAPFPGTAPIQEGDLVLEGRDHRSHRLFQTRFSIPITGDGKLGGFTCRVPLGIPEARTLRSLRVLRNGQSIGEVKSPHPGALPALRLQATHTDGHLKLTWNGRAFPWIMIRRRDTQEVIARSEGGKTSLVSTDAPLEIIASDGVRCRREAIPNAAFPNL